MLWLNDTIRCRIGTAGKRGSLSITRGTYSAQTTSVEYCRGTDMKRKAVLPAGEVGIQTYNRRGVDGGWDVVISIHCSRCGRSKKYYSQDGITKVIDRAIAHGWRIVRKGHNSGFLCRKCCEGELFFIVCRLGYVYEVEPLKCHCGSYHFSYFDGGYLNRPTAVCVRCGNEFHSDVFRSTSMGTRWYRGKELSVYNRIGKEKNDKLLEKKTPQKVSSR